MSVEYPSPFRCPVCKNTFNKSTCFSCSGCAYQGSTIDDIPILVKNISELNLLIEAEKSSGRSSWYEKSQLDQWAGPYRHHLEKRKTYVECLITQYKENTEGPLIGLDLGCGDGNHAGWLTKHLNILYGSDYNLLRLMRAAAGHNYNQLFLADLNDYPIQDSFFDVIFFNHVLEHIADDRRALSEVYRVLKPAGLLILGTPNEGAFFWRLAYKLQPHFRASTDHVHFYTARSLSEKCKEAGFIIKNLHYIGWGLPHWTLDEKIRAYKWADDLLERMGRTLIPTQATSLYLTLTKPQNNSRLEPFAQ